jgi:hypothetical protein
MGERTAPQDEPDGYKPAATLGTDTSVEGKRDESRPMHVQSPTSAVSSIDTIRRDVAVNAELAVLQADLRVPVPGPLRRIDG